MPAKSIARSVWLVSIKVGLTALVTVCMLRVLFDRSTTKRVLGDFSTGRITVTASVCVGLMGGLVAGATAPAIAILKISFRNFSTATPSGFLHGPVGVAIAIVILLSWGHLKESGSTNQNRRYRRATFRIWISALVVTAGFGSFFMGLSVFGWKDRAEPYRWVTILPFFVVLAGFVGIGLWNRYLERLTGNED